MKRAVILAAAIALAGCAQPQQVVWNKEGATEQQFVADRYECVRDAVMTGGTTYIGFGFTERRADPRMFVACMIARGYTPDPSPAYLVRPHGSMKVSQ